MSEVASGGPVPRRFRSPGLDEDLDALGVFEISRQLTYLTTLGVGSQVVYEDGVVEKGGSGYALYALQVLKGYLTKYDLCSDLVERLVTLEEEFRATYSSGSLRRLTSSDFGKLKRLADDLSYSLEHELAKRDFSEMRPRKGVLDYEKLKVEGVGALLRDEGIVARLPAVVAEDLLDAINCVAVGIATPGVMIALRATEGMLRYAHEQIVGPITGSLNWYEVSQKVFEKLESSGLRPKQLEGYIDYLRDVRNSAEHPEKRFGFIEGEDLLMHVQYMIKELFRLIDEARPPSQAPAS